MGARRIFFQGWAKSGDEGSPAGSEDGSWWGSGAKPPEADDRL